ncbi:MAG TPA: hypothetical protein ENI79_04260 [Rhodospirillales bacterium]|nr:hypothetical protein [Rhodospirillales bacterium]
MTGTPRKKNPLYWAFIGLQLLLAAAGVYFWIRGGMWTQGEMPTHGVKHVLAGAVLSLGLLALAALIENRRQGKSRGNNESA